MSSTSIADAMDIGHRTWRIAKDYEADIVLVTADSVADILNAAKVYGVLNNGRFFATAKLLEEL